MEKPKIGIGVITVGERKIHPNIWTKSAHEVFVYTDSERQGPAVARNKVLAHFKDYDYIFIFDDDVYPRREGWEQYFIEQANLHDVGYMALPSIFEAKIRWVVDDMAFWDITVGPFHFFTKKALQTIGGYNTAYYKYGWEDCGLHRRARSAGLTGHVKDASAFPVRGLCYIHANDYFERDNAHYTAVEKEAFITMNIPIIRAEDTSDQLFYPFE